VRSLRGNVVVGAILWTVGLLAVWALVLTFYASAYRGLHVIHSHPHGLLAVAIVAMIAGLAFVRAGLAPLDLMRRRLADVQRGAARQLSGDYPAEVQPLVHDLNALLVHRDQAVSRAIAKAGDLAHGLKTPLAVLSQEAERAAAAGHDDFAAALAEQVERMRRQIEYHLAHARAAAAGAGGGARSSVAESVGGLARTLLRLHADRGIAIDVDVPAGHSVRCQREDLDEMLGNLLDNACKWGKSRVTVTSAVLPPEGGSYRREEGGSYKSREQGGSDLVEITVDDDGSGLDPSMREAVLQRGVRADQAAPGTGLGLAIVRELAELYGGAVALDASPRGGLQARLRLPEAPR
jgi:signal transduction histidine kinase